MKSAKVDTPSPADVPFHDPFSDGAESANRPKAAALGHKSNPSFDEPARAAKGEPAPKPAASQSHDSLDNLMADVVTDRKGKDKPHERKGLDALLNDVQKSKPDSPPKQDAPASLPSLSQADISRVMAEVKIRGKECARQLGQKGVAGLSLVVGKEGRVTQVSVGGSVANTPLAACIEKAVSAASFPRSAGLRFDYRLDVR
jgi:outer membrane biosynthesis protein TonB